MQIHQQFSFDYYFHFLKTRTPKTQSRFHFSPQILAKPGFGEDIREKKLTIPKIERKNTDSINKHVPNFESLSIDSLWRSEPKIHGKYAALFISPWKNFSEFVFHSSTALYSKVLSEIDHKVEEKLKKVQNKSFILGAQDSVGDTQCNEYPVVPLPNQYDTLSVKISNDIAYPSSLLSPGQVQVATQPLPSNHVLSADMFNKEHLNEIFNLAQTFRTYVIKQRPLDHVLKVSSLVVFFEDMLNHKPLRVGELRIRS